jgi:hypothetical protein
VERSRDRDRNTCFNFMGIFAAKMNVQFLLF